MHAPSGAPWRDDCSWITQHNTMLCKSNLKEVSPVVECRKSIWVKMAAMPALPPTANVVHSRDVFPWCHSCHRDQRAGPQLLAPAQLGAANHEVVVQAKLNAWANIGVMRTTSSPRFPFLGNIHLMWTEHFSSRLSPICQHGGGAYNAMRGRLFLFVFPFCWLISPSLCHLLKADTALLTAKTASLAITSPLPPVPNSLAADTAKSARAVDRSSRGDASGIIPIAACYGFTY